VEAFFEGGSGGAVILKGGKRSFGDRSHEHIWGEKDYFGGARETLDEHLGILKIYIRIPGIGKEELQCAGGGGKRVRLGGHGGGATVLRIVRKKRMSNGESGILGKKSIHYESKGKTQTFGKKYTHRAEKEIVGTIGKNWVSIETGRQQKGKDIGI